jgi:hypothetical protein
MLHNIILLLKKYTKYKKIKTHAKLDTILLSVWLVKTNKIFDYTIKMTRIKKFEGK